MNTHNQPASVLKNSLPVLIATSLLAWSQLGLAMKVTGTAIPGQPILINLNPQVAGDDTGVKVLNQEVGNYDISVEQLQDDPVLNLPTPEGFVLLDNTLRVTSTNPAGKRRIRIRMDYGRYNLRDLGVRANSIRLLRLDRSVRASARWVRAEQRIAGRRIADIRFLRLLRDDDFILGHHGIDIKRNFAWAITDTRGDQFFALAGLAIVPLPAAWLLFLSGSGLLWMVSRNRRKPLAAQ